MQKNINHIHNLAPTTFRNPYLLNGYFHDNI